MTHHKQVGEGCQHIDFAAFLVAPPRSAGGLGRSMPRSRVCWKPNWRYGLRPTSSRSPEMGAQPLLGCEPWPSRSGRPLSPRAYRVVRDASLDAWPLGSRSPGPPSQSVFRFPGSQHRLTPQTPRRAVTLMLGRGREHWQQWFPLCG
jgi:hypothetical protein